MFKVKQISKDYREAAPLCTHVNLFGFVDEEVFLTKSGDLGMVLSLAGVDYECLDSNTIENLTKRLAAAFRIFDEKCRVYQTSRRPPNFVITRWPSSVMGSTACSLLISASTKEYTCPLAVKHHYLETEPEKVAFFDSQYSLGLDALPVKQYRARKSADITPRYFVDRYPMFVNSTWATPTLTFTYVDAGAVSLDGFGTHLRAYLQLFRALPRFEFIYIAPSARLFQAAESEFHHVIYGRRASSTSVNILDYFRLRKAWDAKERVSSADVVLLKEAQQRYVGNKVENLYGEWRQGAVGDQDVTRIAGHSTEPGIATFRTLMCGASLKVFSDPFACDAESWTERDLAQEVDQDSGQSSNQVSGL